MEFLIAVGPEFSEVKREKIKNSLLLFSKKEISESNDSDLFDGAGIFLRAYSNGESVMEGLSAYDGCAVYKGDVYTSKTPPKGNSKHGDDFFDKAKGMYCRVIPSEDARKVFVERDILGVYPVWYASYAGIDFVSNNIFSISNAINALGGRVERNGLYSAAELAVENGVWGETGYKGIYLLGAHQKICLSRLGASFFCFEPWYYQSKLSYGHLLECACEEIKENIRAVSESSFSYKVSDLTGGYDSRLILSGIVGQGVEDEFSFFTSGVNTGDSSSASYLRNKYSLKRTMYKVDGSPGDMVDKVKRSLAASYGQHSMADYAQYNPDMIECNGTMGELFRQFYKVPFDVSPIESIKSAYRDRLSVLPVAASNKILKGYEGFFKEKRSQGFSDSEAFFHLYLEQRNQQFVGVSMRSKSNVQTISLPLYSPSGVAAALALPLEERNSLRLVYDITKRLCGELVFPPFENRSWPYCDKDDARRLADVKPFYDGCKDYEDVVKGVEILKKYSMEGAGKVERVSSWEANARRKGWRWNWKHLEKALVHGRACLERIDEAALSDDLDVSRLRDLFFSPAGDFKRNYEVRQVWRSLFAITWLGEGEEFI